EPERISSVSRSPNGLEPTESMRPRGSTMITPSLVFSISSIVVPPGDLRRQLRRRQPLFQLQPILAVDAGIGDFVHQALDEVNSKAPNRAFVDGLVEVGRRSLQGVEGSAAVLDLDPNLAGLVGQPDHDLALLIGGIAVGDDIA